MPGSRTYINFLLDRTGSMQAIKDATIEVFNGFVTNQVAQPGETFWTLTIFDSESIDQLYGALPGIQVPQLTPETYVPRASTPLLDAIGKTTHEALEHVKRHAYDRHVLVIQTDGRENSSKEYTVEAVKKLLQEVEAKDWQIVYLGAGIDAFSEMKQAFATHRASSVQYARSRAGVAEMSLRLSDAVARYRASGRGYWIADVQIYTLQGEKQRALAALREAIDAGWRVEWWYQLQYKPDLEPLHDEPEFQAMLAEIRADMAAQREHVREMERRGELVFPAVSPG